MDQEPRRVLVTGGSSGIGLAVVRAFVAQGDTVVSLDRVESPDATQSVIGDVRDPTSHSEAVRAARGAAGLDVLVANAGIHDGGLGLDADADEFAAGLRAVLDVDVAGYALALHAAAPALTSARGTALLTLSDASFLAGQTGAGIAYTAAKHAQLGILNWAARALAPYVRVNAIAPGGVVTGLRAVDPQEGRLLFEDADGKRSLVASRNPLGTVLEAEEIAELFLWLASPATRGMTAQVIRPDGGLALR